MTSRLCTSQHRRNTRKHGRGSSVWDTTTHPEAFSRAFIQHVSTHAEHHTRATHKNKMNGGKDLKSEELFQQQLDDIHAINDSKRLRSKLFPKIDFPLDYALVKQHKSHLPSALSNNVEDYQKWLSIQPQLTEEGKKRFVLLTELAKNIHNAETVKNLLPLEPQSQDDEGYVPPNTSLNPYENETDPETDHTDEPVEEGISNSPYVGKIKQAQSKQSAQEKAQFEQMALKEADQRQLLMLLVGDVEANMFFDEQGQIRHPQQIIKQTLFLLEPYQMSSSKLGVWAKRVYFYTNYAWKYGRTMTILVVSIMTMFHVGQFILSCISTLEEKKVFQNVLRVLLNKATGIMIVLYNMVVSILSRNFKIKTQSMFNGPTGRSFIQALCVGGPPAMLWWFLNTQKMDYHESEQITIASFAIRTMHDRYKQLDAMNYLAQLTPGFFGEDISSGITSGQLALISRMQEELIKLDENIDNMTDTEFANILTLYTEHFEGEGVTQKQLELGNHMNSAFSMSLHMDNDEEDIGLTSFRKELLQKYGEDIRSLHLLDAYGHPRNVTDICKAFFLYWHKCQLSQRLPTIPYEGKNTLMNYLQMTPLQRLRSKRKTMKTTQNIPSTWWRQHPFLYKKDKTKIPFQDALQTERSSELSLMDIDTQRTIRKHKNWTFRIAQHNKRNLMDRFHLYDNLLLLNEEYDLVKRKEGENRQKMLQVKDT